MDSFLRTELHDSTFILHLGSPDGFPRLTRAVLGELLQQLDAAARSAAVRALVLAGTPAAFATGADLEEVSALTPVEALRFSALGQRVMRSLDQSAKPVIAAVRGYCLGGGFDLALACHLRIAADDAKFGHPGGALGIITGWGGTARLPRIVGRARASEILSSGRMIGAEEAHALRLVNHVVTPDDTIPASLSFASRFPPSAG